MARWARTQHIYDNKYKRELRHMIDAFGKNVSIFHRTDTACGTCTWDPINEESTDPNCAECDGFGRVVSSEEFKVKAVVQKFAGNLGYVREGQFVGQVAPEGQARITMKLSDALLDVYTDTADTIFRNCQKVVADGEVYKPKDTKRFGVKDLYLLEVTLDRIKEETT